MHWSSLNEGKETRRSSEPFVISTHGSVSERTKARDEVTWHVLCVSATGINANIF